MSKALNKIIVKYMLFLILIAAGNNSFGQKMIKIDPELKAKTQPLEVKRKGVSSVGKYEFGSYKIISGKSGLTKSSSNAPLIGDHTSIKSSKEMSFVFINDKADTSIGQHPCGGKYRDR